MLFTLTKTEIPIITSVTCYLEMINTGIYTLIPVTNDTALLFA